MKKKLLYLFYIFVSVIVVSSIMIFIVIAYKSTIDPTYCLPFSDNGICGDGKY